LTKNADAAAETKEISVEGLLQGANGADQASPLDPAVTAQISAFRLRLQASIGEVVLSMMNLPRYRHQTLADVMHLVIAPLTRDRIAIAKTGGEHTLEETAGIAIWASVSEEVDASIREQIQARVFPIRLKDADWNSGDINWLFDVIAPSQKIATAVLANFKQVIKDQPIRVHPVVAQLVNPEVLEKMRISPSENNSDQE
jgi:hemolysin-activating ACP:hemolysin acyltransferase